MLGMTRDLSCGVRSAQYVVYPRHPIHPINPHDRGSDSLRVVIRTHEMQRHIRPVAEHPTVMRLGRDIEE